MSFVNTRPEMLAMAASNLHAIGSAIVTQNMTAAGPTTGVIPAAADAVSAPTATQFVADAAMYQALNAQATAVHDLFVSTVGANAVSYVATKAADAAVIR
jgi:PE family